MWQKVDLLADQAIPLETLLETRMLLGVWAWARTRESLLTRLSLDEGVANAPPLRRGQTCRVVNCQ